MVFACFEAGNGRSCRYFERLACFWDCFVNLAEFFAATALLRRCWPHFSGKLCR